VAQTSHEGSYEAAWLDHESFAVCVVPDIWKDSKDGRVAVDQVEDVLKMIEIYSPVIIQKVKRTI